MIDMIFGIIIESFVELRHRNQKYQRDKINHCFICHINRNTLEKNRINFEEHKNTTHNIWNYVEYIIGLKLFQNNELNSMNNYAKSKIEQNDISFLPTYKDFNKISENKKNILPEEKLIIPEEEIQKYKLKNFSDLE